MPKRKERHKWHAFICYASEDLAFVKSLYDALHEYGLKIWWDRFSLKVGRGLRKAVDEGLLKSRFGIVVLSPSFFEKKFPQTELDGLFVRQMNGRDVILPVWHEIDAEAIRNQALTLADKWAAKSSDGVPAVARQLVEVIKPNALKLETGRANAKRATAQFLSQLEQKNPNLKFRLSTGEGMSPQDCNSIEPVPGAIGSLFHSGMRIDILPFDPKQYVTDPITYSIRLRGQGIEKVKEAIRTGLPQEFTDQEFEHFKTTLNVGLPLTTTKGRLLLQPARLPQRKAPVRVRLGSGQNAVTIPYMEMEQERGGTEEGSYLARTRDGIFMLRAIVRSKSQMEGTIQANTRLKGADVHDLQKYNRATAALQQTGEVEITSIEREASLLQVRCSVDTATEKDVLFRRLVDDLVRVSDYFGVRITWPDQMRDEDIDALEILVAAVDARPIGNGATFTGVITKSPETLRGFEGMKDGGHMVIVREAALEFFGTRIESGTLAYYVENVHVKDFEATRQKLEAAADGEGVEVTYETKSPVIVRRWDKIQPRSKAQ